MLNASQHGTYLYIPFQHIVSYIISVVVVITIIIVVMNIIVSTASSVGELMSRKHS